MEVVPLFERRFYSPAAPYQNQSSQEHSTDASRKDEAGSLQLPSWQADHNRFMCTTATTNHCLHRYPSSTPSAISPDAQTHVTHASAWHPYSYNNDAYLTSRTSDTQAYHGIEPRLSPSKAVYPTAMGMSTTNSFLHNHPNLGDAFHRTTRSVEDQYASLYRMNAYGDASYDTKREWEMSLLKGMPYGKLFWKFQYYFYFQFGYSVVCFCTAFTI